MKVLIFPSLSLLLSITHSAETIGRYVVRPNEHHRSVDSINLQQKSVTSLPVFNCSLAGKKACRTSFFFPPLTVTSQTKIVLLQMQQILKLFRFAFWFWKFTIFDACNLSFPTPPFFEAPSLNG
jgi:hypothetical protein